jgi:6-phosphofructokinase 1
MSLAVSRRNQVDPHGDLWMSVLEATGQPMRFGPEPEPPRPRKKRVAAAG